MDAVKILGSLLSNNATGGNLMGSLLKGAIGGGGQQQAGPSGAAGILGSLLGGGQAAPQQRGGGGIGGLIGGLIGGGNRQQQPQAAGNPLGAALAGLAGQAGGGGLGGLAGLLGGAAAPQRQAPQAPPPPAPQPVQDQATILIRAMCNAAKVDGQVDDAEQQAIVGRMGELDQAEVQFLRQELSSPLDVASFISSIPKGLEEQVYAFSLMAIKLDTQGEAEYLNQLVQGMGIDPSTANAIHDKLGAPRIYS